MINEMWYVQIKLTFDWIVNYLLIIYEYISKVLLRNQIEWIWLNENFESMMIELRHSCSQCQSVFGTVSKGRREICLGEIELKGIYFFCSFEFVKEHVRFFKPKTPTIFVPETRWQAPRGVCQSFYDHKPVVRSVNRRYRICHRINSFPGCCPASNGNVETKYEMEEYRLDSNVEPPPMGRRCSGRLEIFTWDEFFVHVNFGYDFSRSYFILQKEEKLN